MSEYKSMAINGSYVEKDNEKFNRLFTIVTSFVDNEIVNIGDTKTFDVMSAYIKAKYTELKENFKSSELPSFTDIKKVLQSYYLCNEKNGSYVQLIVTRDGVQRLQRKVWEKDIVKESTPKEKKESEKTLVNIDDLIALLSDEQKLAIARTMSIDNTNTLFAEREVEGYFTRTEKFNAEYEVSEKNA